MKTLPLLCCLSLVCAAAFMRAEEAPAAPALTKADQAALADALATVQRVTSTAMDELYNELHAAHPNLTIRKARGGFKKNDYRAYQWLSITIGEHTYWITMFYNDLDFSSGNFHTQYGRIQFWKNIHSQERSSGQTVATPNDRLQGWWRPRMDHQWKKLPPTFLSSEDYSAKKVVSLFEEFLAECGETIP